jgi:tetratricopeptide (TPR) repeat protein
MASSPKEQLLEFARRFAAGEHEAALAAIDALLAEHPNEGPMHWQRARTLEKLERFDEARAAVKRVLELRPNFAPAWVMRAELGEEEGEYDPEPDLRRAIASDPRNARARYLIGVVLYARDNSSEEARAQMDQAVELDPKLHEAFAARAGWSRIEAWTDQAPADADEQEVVVTFTGLNFKRVHLEDALADYDRAIAIEPEPSYRFARAGLLHTLKRFDAAIAELDKLLLELPAEHSLRPLAEEARAKSENQGAGERDQVAKMLLTALEQSEQDKETVAYDQAAAMIRSAADGMRSGKSMPQAMEEFVPDSPEEMAAVSIAWQIRQMAQEAEPNYVPTDPKEYPSHQRAFAASSEKKLRKLGFTKLGDYDPVHLSLTLAKKQMLSIYVREDGHVTAAVYSIKPKWPGFLGWLLMLVKGQYRTANVVELETAFSDGTVLSTNNAGGINPYGQGPHFLQEKLARGMAPAILLERHEARVKMHAASHPRQSIRLLQSIEDVSAQQALQVVAKNAYRRSIGFVSDDELRAMMGEQYDQFAPKVREKLRLMAAEPA